MELVSWATATKQNEELLARETAHQEDQKNMFGQGLPTWSRELSFISSLDEDLDGILNLTDDNIKLGDHESLDNRIQIQEDYHKPKWNCKTR